MWGQTGEDFSGVYYIANHARDGYSSSDYTQNFYLCPSTNTYDAKGDMPFLTTYKERTISNPCPTNSIWIIKFAKNINNVDYYYLQHYDSKKYLTWNEQIVSANADRVRVHLQSNLDEDNEDNNLFFFEDGTKGTDDYNICPKAWASRSNGASLNPAKDNRQNYSGEAYNKSEDFTLNDVNYNCGGLVGVYNKNDETGVWYFEEVTPIITYNAADNTITIEHPDDTATIYYTTNGTNATDELTTSGSTPVTIDLKTSENASVKTIRAIAKIGDKTTGETIYKLALQTTVDDDHKRPYLIQSYHKRWTINGESQGVFYMIHNDVDDEKNTANTTSIFQPRMEWLFKDAGVDESGYQYYYIVNNKTQSYLCYDGGIFVKEAGRGDKYKFRIQANANGGYNIIPHDMTSGSMYLSKNNENGDAVALGSDGNAEGTRWDFVLKSEFDNTPPFTISNSTNGTVYYRLSTNSSATNYVTPASKATGYVTTSSTAAENQNWYFEQVDKAPTDDDDWLTCYYIRNAVTGEYLYFNGKSKKGSNYENAFEMRSHIGSDADNYQYAVVRSTVQDRWNIVPKTQKEVTLKNICSIWKDNNNALKTIETRNNGNAIWQFGSATITVAPPFITCAPDNNSVKISCTTRSITYKYSTTNDFTEPDEPVTTLTDLSEGVAYVPLGEFSTIKVIAVNENASSSPTICHIPVLPTTSTDRPYRIQNVDCSDFYLQPLADGTMKLNTSSLARPSSAWCFEDAGHRGGTQLYRIYTYMDEAKVFLYYNNGTNVCVKNESDFDANNNDFLFYLNPYYGSGSMDGFNIVSCSNTISWIGSVSKGNNTNSDNNTTSNVRLEGIANSNVPMTRWNFIAKSNWNLPESEPIQLSDETQTFYYKIGNLNDEGYYMIPPTGVTGNAMYVNTSNATEDNNNQAWILKKAGNDDWLNYYYMISALTGEYLYYNGDATATNNNTAFITKDMEPNSNDDRSMFVIAKTTTTDNYYIVPKQLKDMSQQNFCSLYRDGGNPLKTTANRNNNKVKWSFTPITSLFCMPPKIKLSEDGKVSLKPITNASTMYYKEANTDFTPKEEGEEILTMEAKTKETITVKAILETNIESEEVERTLVYMPSITLDKTSFFYDGTNQEPVVSKVEIGDEDITDYCQVSYENNVEFGIAKVIVTSKDENYIIYGEKEFSIAKMPLTIKADAQTIEYGDETPVTLTYSALGLAASDVLTVKLSCDFNANIRGDYEITFENLEDTEIQYTIIRDNADVSANYANITLVPSTLTVVPKKMGDGVGLVNGFTAELTPEGNDYSVSVPGLEENIDYTISKETIGDDVVITITGINNYTGSAKLAYITPTFFGKKNEQELRSAYVASNDWVMPDGLKAWIATSVNPAANVVVVKEVNYLPAGVPVILTDEVTEITDDVERQTGKTVLGKSASTADLSNAEKAQNLLRVVTAEEGLPVGAAQVYMFYKGEFVLTLSGTLSKGKVYLENPNYLSDTSGGTPTAGAPRLTIVKSDETTNVEDVISEVEDEAESRWYSLDGRSLSAKPTKKGLYIKNGQKIVVK